MKKFFREFREFAMKGNVIDMAVGVIIGGAFGKIISSFVSDIVMPPIGLLLGKTQFTNLSIVLHPATAETAAVTLNYGSFIQTIMDFLLIAMSIFIMIRIINSARRKAEEMERLIQKREHKDMPAPDAPATPEPDNTQQLLTEIRDLLKEMKK